MPRHILIAFHQPHLTPGVDLEGVVLPEGCAISTDAADIPHAAAVVFHVPNFPRPPALPKRPGQLWVAWSMESSANYPQLDAADYMRHFDLTMTYRLDSDIPLPYVCFLGSAEEAGRALRRPFVAEGRDRLATLMVSSPYNRSGRLEFAAELMRYAEVDSYGRQLRTHDWPGDSGRPSKLGMLARYKFTLAFENSVAPDYVTEKFYDALAAGSVPVYLGAPNVEAFAPGERCYIDASQYPSARALAAYLRALGRLPDAYAEYHAWRARPFRPSFERILELHREHWIVRLCAAVQARLGSATRARSDGAAGAALSSG